MELRWDQADGTPGHVVNERTWDDYPLGRGSVRDHLRALDSVYAGVIDDHRSAIAACAAIDPVTEDLFIGQTAKLELFQWFVRSHIEDSGGQDPATESNGRQPN